MMAVFVSSALLLSAGAGADRLEAARDTQDLAALDAIVEERAAAARAKPGDAEAQYRLALAHSYLAEVALEMGDKARAKQAAEKGIRAAEAAVAIEGRTADHHRILGTLCGQIIPANILTAFKYGRCARESIDKSLELDPGHAMGYLSRGVGNYYLPAALGGGMEPAVRDFEKAIELDPGLAEAYLWLGLALRRMNRPAEARAALAKSLTLNPNRVWAKRQLEKTPAK